MHLTVKCEILTTYAEVYKGQIFDNYSLFRLFEDHTGMMIRVASERSDPPKKITRRNFVSDYYRVSHNTGHLKIWLSPRPDFIKGLGLSQISGCPVLCDTL